MNLLTIEQRIPSIATVLVLVIVGASFALSYTALVALAIDAGVPGLLAPLWPLCLDAFMAVASLVVLRRELDGQPVIWAWVVVGGITILSIVFNVVHAPENLISRSVYALPPLVVFISFEMLMSLIKADIRKMRECKGPIGTPDPCPDNAGLKSPDSVTTRPGTDPIVIYYNDHPDTPKTIAATDLRMSRSTLTRRIKDLVNQGILIEHDGKVRVSQ